MRLIKTKFLLLNIYYYICCMKKFNYILLLVFISALCGAIEIPLIYFLYIALTEISIFLIVLIYIIIKINGDKDHN